MVRFSVVTSTRNRPDWLPRAVDSVRAQTFEDFEHIIYDNGSDHPADEDISGASAAVAGKKEIEALVAYLQQLGTLLQTRR